MLALTFFRDDGVNFLAFLVRSSAFLCNSEILCGNVKMLLFNDFLPRFDFGVGVARRTGPTPTNVVRSDWDVDVAVDVEAADVVAVEVLVTQSMPGQEFEVWVIDHLGGTR